MFNGNIGSKVSNKKYFKKIKCIANVVNVKDFARKIGLICNNNLPISSHYFIFMHPENDRKPLVF